MSYSVIWVVSDDPEIRQYLQTVLEHASYHVRTFMASQDALECMQQYPALVPHLVCIHPRSLQDGYTVSKRIKNSSATPAIILFSPFTNTAIERSHMRQAGVDRLLAIPNPYNITNIVVEIATLLQPKDKS